MLPKNAPERVGISISYMKRVQKPYQKIYSFWNGVPEGSHSRPPGRSKSTAFERIFVGRKAPSDLWPGPPRCLVATQEVSDVHRSLCKILMVVVEYHHHLRLQQRNKATKLSRLRQHIAEVVHGTCSVDIYTALVTGDPSSQRASLGVG